MGKAMFGTLALLGALSVGAGLAGLDGLFEEPTARPVASLAAELACRSVLGVFAHPDDEILVSATLADAARRGCEVVTVTATRGERGAPPGFAGTRADLVRTRERELRRYGSRLGIRDQILWDFADGRLAEVPLDILRDSIAAAIQRFRPDLVVTFDSAAGFTGHPDHRRVGAAALAAFTQVDSSAGAVHRARWLARMVFPRRAAVLVRGEPGRLLRRQPSADVGVAVEAKLKLLGMSDHGSQRQYFPPPWARPILYRLYDREHFALMSVPRDS